MNNNTSTIKNNNTSDSNSTKKLSTILFITVLISNTAHSETLKIYPLYNNNENKTSTTINKQQISSYETKNITHKTKSSRNAITSTQSVIHGNTVYYIADSSIYSLSPITRTRLYHTTKTLISLHVTSDAVIFSDNTKNIYRLDLKTGVVDSIELYDIAIKFIQDEDKLMCICANGSITCVFLGNANTTKDSRFGILWHIQSDLPEGAYILNPAIHNNMLYCFHTPDTLSIVDTNSGAIYKQIFVPYKKFAHAHIYTEEQSNTTKVYCVSDRSFSAIDYKNSEWTHIITRSANYICAVTDGNKLFAANDSKIFTLNHKDNLMYQFYNMSYYDELLFTSYIQAIFSSSNYIYIVTTKNHTLKISKKNKHVFTMPETVLSLFRVNNKEYTFNHIYNLGNKLSLKDIE